MTRLPGWCYTGSDPDGFLRSGELRPATWNGTPPPSTRPSSPDTTVVELTAAPDRLGTTVSHGHGTWRARSVVVATGPHGRAPVPAGVSGAPASPVITANRTATPAALAPGGVLVVGASASGVQIADELSAVRPRRSSGRRPAHPDAASLPRDGQSSGGWMPPVGSLAPSTRCVIPVRLVGSPRCSWSAAQPVPTRPRATSTWRALQRARRPPVGRLEGLDGAQRVVRRATSRQRSRGRRPRHAPLARLRRRYVDDAGLTREVLRPGAAPSGQPSDAALATRPGC